MENGLFRGKQGKQLKATNFMRDIEKSGEVGILSFCQVSLSLLPSCRSREWGDSGHVLFCSLQKKLIIFLLFKAIGVMCPTERHTLISKFVINSKTL